MTYIYNNTECCENCPNNRSVNPYASGVCCCSLPYMSTTPLSQQNFNKPNDYEKHRQSDTITVTNVPDSADITWIKADNDIKEPIIIPSVWLA